MLERHGRDSLRRRLLGLSTGARTAEGLQRIRQAATKHGYYSKAATLERAHGQMLMRELADVRQPSMPRAVAVQQTTAEAQGG